MYMYKHLQKTYQYFVIGNLILIKIKFTQFVKKLYELNCKSKLKNSNIKNINYKIGLFCYAAANEIFNF